jgi:flagellar biosynthesis/type III secretory pathway ATPase
VTRYAKSMTAQSTAAAAAEYASLIARFTGASEAYKTAERYREQGYDLTVINDYLRPIVISIDDFEAAYDM